MSQGNNQERWGQLVDPQRVEQEATTLRAPCVSDNMTDTNKKSPTTLQKPAKPQEAVEEQ